MSGVTEEAINIALIAYHRTRPHEGAVVAMRAALAAVAPLIAAQERERCARVADAKEDEYETSYRAGLKSSQHLQGMSDGAGEVAAAIRALGDDKEGA